MSPVVVSGAEKDDTTYTDPNQAGPDFAVQGGTAEFLSKTNVPAVSETIKDFDASAWVVMFAPAGTPATIVGRLNSEVVKVMKRPDIINALKNEGAEAAGTTAKTLKFWDLAGAPTPSKVAEYVGNPTAIVHNAFIRGNLAIMSYYTAGMRVVDISDPNNPLELGGYDSYPANDDAEYTGAWSVYPFFPSGRIVIGDMATGMYIVEVNVNGPLAPSPFSASSDYTTPTSVAPAAAARPTPELIFSYTLKVVRGRNPSLLPRLIQTLRVTASTRTICPFATSKLSRRMFCNAWVSVLFNVRRLSMS